MEFSRWRNFFVAMIMLKTLAAGFAFISNQTGDAEMGLAAIANSLQKNISVANANQKQLASPVNEKNYIVEILPKKLSDSPKIIKAVYVTGWSAGTKSYLNYLTNLFKTTEINAVVVDIKDYSGLISYKSGAISDINALVKFFHNQNIYVIGRIAVFEDPAFSKARPDLAIYDKTLSTDSAQAKTVKNLWLDNHKLSWLDPASKEVWDYNISIAKDVSLHGFDEINFDYIRFPSDGKTKNMGFPFWDEKTPRHVVLTNFFKYLRQELPEEKLSVDLFGQTTVNYDDLGIGQVIEDALQYFDYISPMVYPSHYATNFIGFTNPAEHPYEVIFYSMSTALAKKTAYENLLESPVNLAKLRPWLQDFDMGADYTAEMVKSEITATEDALKDEYNGYMLWNPSNIYTQEAVSQ